MSPSGISCTVLVTAQDFGGRLSAAQAAGAIARGLRAIELETDLCPIEPAATALPSDFDARMRAARAVVIAAARLDHETLLQREAMCEIATRARQSGVPCYAISKSSGLDLFEARILDLQVVLEAGDEPGLTAAGRRLARIA